MHKYILHLIYSGGLYEIKGDLLTNTGKVVTAKRNLLSCFFSPKQSTLNMENVDIVILVVVKALHLADIVAKRHFGLATSDRPNHLQQTSVRHERVKESCTSIKIVSMFIFFLQKAPPYPPKACPPPLCQPQKEYFTYLDNDRR